MMWTSLKGGYLFPAYDPKIAENLKGLLPIQKSFGLEIDWIGPEEVRERVPGIRAEGLLGGTFSPKTATSAPSNWQVPFTVWPLRQG